MRSRSQSALPASFVAGMGRLSAEVVGRAAAAGAPIELDWERELSARTPRREVAPGGRISLNRTCRLLRCRDGWAAVSLARPSDIASVEALTGASGDGHWAVVEAAAAVATTAGLVGRARLLGVPAAALATPAVEHLAPVRCELRGSAGPSPGLAGLRVVDLSSLWAGPLVGSLLWRAGAAVTKVESAARPDGARARPDFYRRLHPDDQPSVVLDFSSPAGRAELRELLAGADVVIEASRPRALQQLGCGPDQVPAGAGRIWLSITGYGRQLPGADWVAWGDDAAVAGGLVGADGEEPVFLGDAVADPVTGMAAAAAVFGAVAAGGGVLLDVAMAGCAAAVAGGPPCGC